MSGIDEQDIGQAVLDALDEDIREHGAVSGVMPPERPAPAEPQEPPAKQPEEPEEEEVALDDGGAEVVEDEGKEEGTPEEPEEEDKEEADEPSGDEPLALSFSSSDPEVVALLSRYDNDPEKALKAYGELQRALTRQGQDKNALAQRVQQLEAQLAEQQLFHPEPSFLTEEEQAWVGEAVGSGQPQLYVRQAIQAQRFDLGRAIVEQWAGENPYAALRAGQALDNAEQQAYQAQEPVSTFDISELLVVLAQHYPDLPGYEQQIIETISTLGDEHPLVALARSGVPEEAARGVISLYEIARAKRATVAATKDGVKRKQKEAGDRARRDAVVSSAQSSPVATQAPRPTEIAPGLTWERYLEELE